MSGLTSALQLSTVDGERGRVFAMSGAVNSTGQAAGMLAAGLLGDRLPLAWLLDAHGLLIVLGGVVALLWMSARTPSAITAAAGADPGSTHTSPEPDHAV
ncbi:hypothetical protein [Streptacidiphilus jiangxiensis]|uniref:Major facilitator superfamily (MFS) profile domain-containing protein n=1 Tax=Streptacidiphilus jiangxiensis TaxID=235985 RepID=A0A1H7I9V5_STRJI|nr:hypothetical protein [Streptacidiphilus jiangxiensis]SEK57355.1 hypothetical protein SAMN05414137_102496 [Streptacidiphilus jiangxiensis]